MQPNLFVNEPRRRRAPGGQAMGLNVFLLFTGFGVGSLLFGAAAGLGFTTALLLFAAVEFLAALLAVPLFRHEQRSHSP